jgi:putative PIN family toxin of toxin-antitoxin system
MLGTLVFDTNVLISAALLPQSASARALVLALERFELCLSEPTWTELQQVIARPKFARYLSDEARHQFLQRLISVSRFAVTQSVVKDCADPKDNPFLELALDVQARCVVSGDQHLLALEPWRGITICTPSQFLLHNQ